MATTTSTLSRRSFVRRSGYLTELWDRRAFTMNLALGNIAGKHASDALGVLWWVLNPLLMTGVYFVVFGLLLGGRKGDPAYLAYLLAGVFSFRFMSGVMVGSAKMITNNAKLVTTIRFPRLVLPIAALIEGLVAFLVSLATFYLIVAPVNQIYPTVWLAFFPVALLIHTAFTFGFGALTARLVVPIPDVKNLVPHMTRMWFYLSPILWPVSFIEDKPTWIQALVKSNPMYAFLSVYRTALLGRPLEVEMLLAAVAWAALFLAIGVTSFVRNEGAMARHL
jgi:teichoic acid transport system permease protein